MRGGKSSVQSGFGVQVMGLGTITRQGVSERGLKLGVKIGGYVDHKPSLVSTSTVVVMDGRAVNIWKSGTQFFGEARNSFFE